MVEGPGHHVGLVALLELLTLVVVVVRHIQPRNVKRESKSNFVSQKVVLNFEFFSISKRNVRHFSMTFRCLILCYVKVLLQMFRSCNMTCSMCFYVFSEFSNIFLSCSMIFLNGAESHRMYVFRIFLSCGVRFLRCLSTTPNIF